MVSHKANQPKRLHKLGLLLVCVCGVGRASGQVYDRAVALVDGHVITSNELDFEARIFLIRNGGPGAAHGELGPQAQSSALEALIGQRLLVAEADKLKTYVLEDEVLDRELRAFKERMSSESALAAFLKEHQADEAMLVAVLGRFVRAQRVLDSKFKLRAQVGDAEVIRYLAEHPELKALPLERVRQKLVKDRFVALTTEALREQRQTADVRLFGPWAARFEPGADGGAR